MTYTEVKSRADNLQQGHITQMISFPKPYTQTCKSEAFFFNTIEAHI